MESATFPKSVRKGALVILAPIDSVISVYKVANQTTRHGNYTKLEFFARRICLNDVLVHFVSPWLSDLVDHNYITPQIPQLV